jgi:5'-nucleotidase
LRTSWWTTGPTSSCRASTAARNLAEDVTYSGTVSAAMEGALAGIPRSRSVQSYARQGMGDSVPFGAAEPGPSASCAPLSPLLRARARWSTSTFPPCRPTKSAASASRAGLRDYGRLRIDKRTDARGYDYFWFGW